MLMILPPARGCPRLSDILNAIGGGRRTVSLAATWFQNVYLNAV